MELRRLLLSLALAWFPPGKAAASIRAYPLDAQAVTTVTLGVDEPTTCVFPGAPTALEGANVATQPGEGVAVLLSHQPGQSFFSVRALRPDAKAGLNVVYQGRVYALRLVAGAVADRSVTFLGETPPLPPQRLRALLDHAKLHGLRAAQIPAVAETFTRAAPQTVTRYRDFEVTLEEVFRHEADNALVFHVRLENRSGRAVAYDADGLGVRVGREAWTAAAADASGAIPPRATTQAYFVVTAELAATAPFTVTVPAP